MMLRIKAILLLFLFAFSTFGNALEVHYCNGEITDIAFVGSATCVCNHVKLTDTDATCHALEAASCEMHGPCCETEDSSTKFTENDCCETATVQLISGVAFQYTTADIQKIAVAWTTFYPELWGVWKAVPPIDDTYEVPDFSEDINLRIQRFLI